MSVENSKGMKNAQKNIENKMKLNQNQMKKYVFQKVYN